MKIKFLIVILIGIIFSGCVGVSSQGIFGTGVSIALDPRTVGTQIDENTGGETSDITSVSAKYTIAAGLDAYLTYHDYDYEAGTSGDTDDDGSVTYLTLKAKF